MDPCSPDGDDRLDSGRESPAIGQQLDLLSDPTHRAVIDYFMSRARSTFDLDEIAETVVEEGATEAVDRDELRIRLHHVHLPKLAEAGIIEFAPRDGQVRYLPDGGVEDMLGRIRRHDRG